MSEDDLQSLLHAGIEAVQSGRPAVARALFDRIIARDPNHEAAWLWKATVAETLDERRTCLRRVLVINPENPQAGRALAKLQRRTAAAAGRQAEARSAQQAPTDQQVRAALVSSASRSPRRRLLLPFALMLLALGLLAAGAFLLASAQREANVAPTANLLAPPDQAWAATLDALRAPSETATPTPPGGLRMLPSRRDHLPPTWTPVASETTAPDRTPPGPSPTSAGQTRRGADHDACHPCSAHAPEGAL